MEVPSGWVQVLRSPRPRAEKWPSAAQKNKHGGFPVQSLWGGGVNQVYNRQRQPENAGSPTSNGRFPRSRGGCSEERVVECAAISPNMSIEGTACQERRVHTAFGANCISGAGTRRRTGVVGQGSGSAGTVETGGGSSRTSASRGPHAEVEHEVLLLRRSWPSWKRNESRIRPRVCRRRREFAVAIDVAQNWPTNQQDLHSWLESEQLELRDALDVHDLESVRLQP